MDLIGVSWLMIAEELAAAQIGGSRSA